MMTYISAPFRDSLIVRLCTSVMSEMRIPCVMASVILMFTNPFSDSWANLVIRSSSASAGAGSGARAAAAAFGNCNLDEVRNALDGGVATNDDRVHLIDWLATTRPTEKHRRHPALRMRADPLGTLANIVVTQPCKRFGDYIV